MTGFVPTQKGTMGKGKGPPKLKQSRCNSSIECKPHGFQQSLNSDWTALNSTSPVMCFEKQLPRETRNTLLCKAKKYFCSQISEEDYFDLYCSKYPLNEENKQQSYQNQPKSVILIGHLLTLSPSLSGQIHCLMLHYGKVDNLSHLLGTNILRGKKLVTSLHKSWWDFRQRIQWGRIRSPLASTRGQILFYPELVTS